jgi:hypothetical protein
MENQSDSLPNIPFASAHTTIGTPTNEVVGNAAKHGTSKTIFNPCMSDKMIKSPIKRKVGRPRIHKNHAAAQRAYRRRQKINAARAIRQAGQLKVVPLHLRQANELVAQLHRHHKPIRVAKFSIGASKEGKLVGAAICMRPACRSLDDGKTIEVCRLVTDGTDNACSLLYATCAKIAKLMGYEKAQTYILDTEPGTSLKATGWVLEKTGCGGKPQGKRTNRPNEHEVTPVTFTTKQRWAKLL